MKRTKLLVVLVWGMASEWFARVIKEGSQKVEGRQVQATTARHAVNKAISLYGKEPRTCRRCGRVWECRVYRQIRICPACQHKKEPVSAAS